MDDGGLSALERLVVSLEAQKGDLGATGESVPQREVAAANIANDIAAFCRNLAGNAELGKRRGGRRRERERERERIGGKREGERGREREERVLRAYVCAVEKRERAKRERERERERVKEEEREREICFFFFSSLPPTYREFFTL